MKILKILILSILHLNLIFTQDNKRPPISERKFISTEVDKYIESIKNRFKNPELSKIFENCFPNTLDTTVEYDEKLQDTFIITGDIEAMWLRDSSFQIFPYIGFAKKDLKLKKMMLNLIKRHSKSVLIDPYANAFNKNEKDSPWQTDETYKLVNGQKVLAMNKKIWERKYELDSTISTLFFAYSFYKQTGDNSFITDDTWQASLQSIVNLVKKEMRGSDEEDSDGGPEYFFQRSTSESFDSLHQGRGNPVRSCGLVKSMFRNSDDATTFAYNIPENAFMVATFKKIAQMIKEYLKNIKVNTQLPIVLTKLNLSSLEIKKLKLKNLISDLESLSSIVEKSIYKNGVFTDQETGDKYFAYEVDCYGNHYFLDDPGYPSLTALPFFNFISINDPIYINTRKRILSDKNPYYYKTNSVEGMGSAHSARHFIWPLFTIMKVLTSHDDREIIESINLLVESAKKTGFMHESFNISKFEDFTRPWFAWANSFFGYMINHVIQTRPNLILN